MSRTLADGLNLLVVSCPQRDRSSLTQTSHLLSGHVNQRL